MMASRVEAFDDWFSNFDDKDDFTANNVIVPTKSRIAPDDFDHDDWVESSDDESVIRKKKKGISKEKTSRRQTGDLERIFWDASAEQSSEKHSSGKKENKALKVLRDESQKKAQRVVEARMACRRDSKERRNNVSLSIDKHLSGSSDRGRESDGSGTEMRLKRPESTPRRPRKSPIRRQSDFTKPAIQLAALYGIATPSVSSSANGSSENGDCEGVSHRVEPIASRRQNGHRSSQNRSHVRSRDPLSSSRHDALSRSTTVTLSSKCSDVLSMSAHHPRERRTYDPLSRSSHGRPRQTLRRSASKQDVLSAGSFHGSIEQSRTLDSSRRGSHIDSLSTSAHHPRGAASSSKRESRRENPLSRPQQGSHPKRNSSHSPVRNSSLRHRSHADDRKREGGLSQSVHGDLRPSSRDNLRGTRSPSDLERAHRRRMHHQSQSPDSSRMDYPILNRPSGDSYSSRLEPRQTEEEAMLRLAIGNIKGIKECDSLPGSRGMQVSRPEEITNRRRRSRSSHGL
jgi:hypothetical protein